MTDMGEATWSIASTQKVGQEGQQLNNHCIIVWHVIAYNAKSLDVKVSLVMWFPKAENSLPCLRSQSPQESLQKPQQGLFQSAIVQLQQDQATSRLASHPLQNGQ
jgi:hypothetical protein